MKNNQHSNTSIFKPLAIIVMAMFLLLNGAGGHALASEAVHKVHTAQTIASEPGSTTGRIIVKTSGHNKGLVPAEVHLMYYHFIGNKGTLADTGLKCTTSEPGVFIFDHVDYSNFNYFNVDVIKQVDQNFDGVLKDVGVASVSVQLYGNEVTVNLPIDYDLLVGTINVTYDKHIPIDKPPVVVDGYFKDSVSSISPSTTSDAKSVIHFNYRSNDTVLILHTVDCPALDKGGWKKVALATTSIDLTKSYTLHMEIMNYRPIYGSWLDHPLTYGFTLNVAK